MAFQNESWFNWDSRNGPVLLDFFIGPHTIPQAGYCMDGVVLTVASPILHDILLSSLPNGGKNKIYGDSSTIDMSKFQLHCYLDDNGTLQKIEKCSVTNILVSKSINTIVDEFSKLNLVPYRADSNGQSISTSKFTAMFLLIKLGPGKIDEVAFQKSLKKSLHHSSNVNLVQGQDVFTVYTPFGANEFLNSYSKGCLCNTINDTLYLIDGRLTSGCEGAPVYTKGLPNGINFPIGLILFAIAVGNDHSSYSLVAPMHILIDALFKSSFQLLHKEDSPSPPTLIKRIESLQGALSNIVIVQAPNCWASGIVVGQGLVLTNAHVIGFGAKSCNPVYVKLKNCSVAAQVVVCSRKYDILDFALLQYNRSIGPSGIPFSHELPQKGEEVIAIGHPLRQNDHTPSLTRGAILNHWKESAGFSTSCIINAGSSGGSIVRENGELLGIVVGILRTNDCAYPEMNICMVAKMFQEPIRIYQSTGDKSRLMALTTYDDPWLRTLLSLPKSKY